MNSEQTKYCPFCGTMIPYEDSYCPACGESQPVLGIIHKPPKPAWVAIILSLLITGLGQVYLGNWRRGATFFFGTIIIGFLASYYYSYDQIMIIGVLFALISAYDAYRLSQRQSK